MTPYQYEQIIIFLCILLFLLLSLFLLYSYDKKYPLHASPPQEVSLENSFQSEITRHLWLPLPHNPPSPPPPQYSPPPAYRDI